MKLKFQKITFYEIGLESNSVLSPNCCTVGVNYPVLRFIPSMTCGALRYPNQMSGSSL